MDNFKEIRLKKKMTQEELATKANISLRQLVRIEKEECRPNLETKILLYKALDISNSKILDYIDKNYLK